MAFLYVIPKCKIIELKNTETTGAFGYESKERETH